MENFEGHNLKSGAEGHIVGNEGPGEINLEFIMEHGEYADIPLPVLVEQYGNLKEFEAIINRDIRGESEEGGQSKIVRGRELLEEIKNKLHLKSDASYAEVTAEREKLHTYLKSIGMASDDGR